MHALLLPHRPLLPTRAPRAPAVQNRCRLQLCDAPALVYLYVHFQNLDRRLASERQYNPHVNCTVILQLASVTKWLDDGPTRARALHGRVFLVQTARRCLTAGTTESGSFYPMRTLLLRPRSSPNRTDVPHAPGPIAHPETQTTRARVVNVRPFKCPQIRVSERTGRNCWFPCLDMFLRLRVYLIDRIIILPPPRCTVYK